MTLSGEAADRNSAARAAKNRRTINILALFVVVLFLVLAGLLQRQQTATADFVHEMCLQRRANTILTNETLVRLQDLERRNPNQAMRGERVRIYEDAKLTVPTCEK